MLVLVLRLKPEVQGDQNREAAAMEESMRMLKRKSDDMTMWEEEYKREHGTVWWRHETNGNCDPGSSSKRVCHEGRYNTTQQGCNGTAKVNVTRTVLHAPLLRRAATQRQNANAKEKKNKKKR